MVWIWGVCICVGFGLMRESISVVDKVRRDGRDGRGSGFAGMVLELCNYDYISRCRSVGCGL